MIKKLDTKEKIKQGHSHLLMFIKAAKLINICRKRKKRLLFQTIAVPKH